MEPNDQPLRLKNLIFAVPECSEELDYKHHSAGSMFFNAHAGTRTFIEKYDGEAYMHLVKQKIEEKFGMIDKLVGSEGGLKMDTGFKTQIKGIITEIYGINRRSPKYWKILKNGAKIGETDVKEGLASSGGQDISTTAPHLNLKYLFLSVVYLRLKTEFFESLGSKGLEVGINDLVRVYGSGDVCLSKLGRYLEFVKTIARDFGFGINLKFQKEQKIKLVYWYQDLYLNLLKKLIQGHPNALYYKESKFKSIFRKVFESYGSKDTFLLNKRLRHIACAIVFISLRICGISLTLLDVIEILKKEPILIHLHYSSVTRIIREICDECVDKFIQLLMLYESKKEVFIKKLGNLFYFLKVHLDKIDEIISQTRVNIKSALVLGIVKFMIKKRVIKLASKLNKIGARKVILKNFGRENQAVSERHHGCQQGRVERIKESSGNLLGKRYVADGVQEIVKLPAICAVETSCFGPQYGLRDCKTAATLKEEEGDALSQFSLF